MSSKNNAKVLEVSYSRWYMDNLPRGVNKTALMIYLVVEGENVKGNVS